MKKDTIFLNKPWMILSVAVFVMVLIAFSSVSAGATNMQTGDFNPWTSNGYKEVTVRASRDLNAVVAAPQEECVLNPTGMVSHWPLDEQSGVTTFVDVVSSKNGTCIGDTCPSKTFGKVGGAFTFVASERDIVSVPGDAIYDTMANGDFSAGVWVKTTQTCAVSDELKNKVFFGRHNRGTWSAWWLGCTEPGGVAVFRLRDSTKTYRQINGTSKITDGQWHHIIGVRDAGSDEIYLYVDGELEGDPLASPLYTGNFSSDMPITMGAYNEPTNYYLDGTLDEVVLYDRVMPANEIGSYFEACKTASTITFLPIIVR